MEQSWVNMFTKSTVSLTIQCRPKYKRFRKYFLPPNDEQTAEKRFHEPK